MNDPTRTASVRDESNLNALQIFHVNFNVTDLTRSRAFYEAIGFKVVNDFSQASSQGASRTFAEIGLAPILNLPADCDARALLLALTDDARTTRLDLIEWIRPKSTPASRGDLARIGFGRLCLKVRDAQKIHDTLVAGGFNTAMRCRMQLIERLGSRMKLQDLHVLMTVVQAGSMGKAAQRLNTVQPAISRSIADLEHALGVRLLDRHPYGIEPTPYGRALLDCGAAVFDDLRQGVKNIAFLADPAAGEVRIGSNPFLAAGFVAAVMDRLSRRYPRMSFHLVTGPSYALYRELNERNVDVLITILYDPIEHPQMEAEPLYDDPLVVAAGVQSPWSRRRRIQLSELVNESWLVPPPDGAIGLRFREAFRASGLDVPRATLVTIPPEVRINLLTTGRFLSVFPASILKFFTRHSQVRTLPVKLLCASVPSGIVTLKQRTLSPAVQGFIQVARELAKPLVVKK